MNARIAALGCVSGALLLAGSAAAQAPVSPGENASPTPYTAPQPPQGVAPNPATIQPEGEQGRWVNTGESGWIWVPEDATTYAVDGVPYTYLYTPVYGWTWYASPWGWGPFFYGPWVSHPWPFGFSAWGYGRGGWGWRGGSWRGGHFYAGGWHGGGGHAPPAFGGGAHWGGGHGGGGFGGGGHGGGGHGGHR